MEGVASVASSQQATGFGLRVHRLGDVALFLLWVVPTLLNGGGVAAAIAEDDLLAAAYRLIVATVILANGVLFLVRGPAVRRDAGLGAMLIAFVGTWSVVPLSVLPLTWRPDWLLALTTAGLMALYAFVFWALLTLRSNFSVFPEARELVRHGPYALVRHPLYAAYIGAYVLLALPRLSALALALAAVGIVGEVLRARNEERLLAETFADYEAYAAATPRFLPRVA